MRKRRKILAMAAVLLVLTGCASPASPAPTALPTATAAPSAEKTSGIGFFFDTTVTITLYGAREGLMDEIWAACGRYERLLSKTIAESDVSRINTANGSPVTVDPETWEILRRAKEISALTEGAFSVTIAPLTAMWDFTGGTNRMPTEAQRLAALPLVDDQQITLGEGYTVTLPAGMQVDLGGIAKGYIADRVADLVREQALGAIISLGGNIYVVGDKPDGSLMSVAIQDPSQYTGMPLGVVYAKDVSVVTSGTYERGFTGPDGLYYHHILDPATGSSARSDLVSATFVMASSMDADALATACIVKGSAWALELCEQQGLDAMFITADGTSLFTEGFEETYRYVLYADLVKN